MYECWCKIGIFVFCFIGKVNFYGILILLRVFKYIVLFVIRGCNVEIVKNFLKFIYIFIY